MKKHSYFLRRSDVLLILTFFLLAVLAALVFWPQKSGDATAIVRRDGETVMTLRLSDYATASSTEITVGEVTLEIEQGKIRFLRSPCPDQLCVRTGFLSQPGDTAVCLPERVSVEIVSGGGTP